jgi:hypothetical protein
MFRRIVIGDHERVLVTRKRRFETILDPGVYWIFTGFRGISLEHHNTAICSSRANGWPRLPTSTAIWRSVTLP